jgi:hypothetical protein
MSKGWWLASAIISIAVLSCLLYLTSEHDVDEGEETAHNGYLSEESPAFSALRDQLDALAQSVKVISDSVNTPVDRVPDGQLLVRLNEIEERLEELERLFIAAVSSNEESTGDRQANEVLSQVRSMGEYRSSTVGETAFEVDEGEPLGGYSEAIYDSIHEVGDVVQLHDFHCKKSICKITYSGDGAEYDRFADSEDPGTLLLDKLSDDLGGKGLDITFGREAGGNQVMYVKLR